MSRPSHILLGILLFLVFLMMLLPIIQDKFEFFELEPLNGDIIYAKEDTLTAENWFSGKYQEKKEAYVNDSFGLRNFCVRFNNQIAFSLFKLAKANEIIVGKENYLFEENYISSYLGQDLISEEKAEVTMQKLKFVSDTLAKLNKQVLIVFAAGKASFYSEHIPDRYKRMNEQTNYKLLSQKAKQTGINVIDVNAWFMAEKNRSPYPLYPQYGIHWSEYGSVLVADTLIKTIEHLRNIDMPDVYYDKVTMEQPDGIDYDIGDGMNLLFKLESFDMANIKVKFEKSKGKTRPRVIVISDSFYWGIYDFGIGKSFSDDQFWYYNKQAFPQSFKEETFVMSLNLQREINNHDVIVIMATESNLSGLGWGFIEDAHELYKGHSRPHTKKYHDRVKQLAEYILQDPVWLKEAAKKAKTEGVSLRVQVYKEAEWMVTNQEGLY